MTPSMIGWAVFSEADRLDMPISKTNVDKSCPQCETKENGRSTVVSLFGDATKCPVGFDTVSAYFQRTNPEAHALLYDRG